MTIKIYKSKYKDKDALTIESKEIKAQFLPEIGGKMCSLIYKPQDLELLIQKSNEKYKMQNYDGRYVDGECSGFDDMFPSIDECYYETFPWKGIKIPDHGELWSIPWTYKIIDREIIFTSFGIRFPYKFERIVKFTNSGALQFKYNITNLSNFDIDFMWAAHPMYYLKNETNLILPEGVKNIVSVLERGQIFFIW